MKSSLVALVVSVYVGAVSGCSLMLEWPRDCIERRLTFFPRRLDKDAPTPAGVESIWFSDVDAESGAIWRLHGLLAEAPRPYERRAVVLYCHGNRGCVDHCAERIRETADRFNITVFSFDYRGFGRSDGDIDEAGVLHSARAARAWLAARAGVTESSVVLMGMSLGGGVAVDLAGRDGCRGLILENTFTSIGDAADYVLPVAFPSRWMKSKFNSIETIKNYHGPLLQRHGDCDPLIPFHQGEKLFEAAPGPKKFVKSPGGMHRCPPTEEFYAAMDEFLNSLPPERSMGEVSQFAERVCY